MIRNYMLMETDPAEHERSVTQTRSDLETEIKKGLAGLAGERIFHFRWHLVRHLVNVTKYFSRIRENSRFYHTLGFYVVRKKILQMEKTFIAEGKLRCRGDIFYLRLEEVSEIAARQSRVGGRGRTDTRTAHAAYPAVKDKPAKNHQRRSEITHTRTTGLLGYVQQ